MTEAASSGFRRLATLVLLGAILAQCCIAAVRDSVTVDEVAHVAVGLAMWRSGDLSLDPINPPLPRLLLALPPLAMGAKLEPRPELDEWKLGLVLMREDTDRYHDLHVAARAVTIALALVLAALVWSLAARLGGSSAALPALALFAFSPTILAHGHLATVDLVAGLTYAAVVASAARHVERPSTASAALTGAVLGLAIACKLSSGVAVVIVVTALGIGESRRRETSSWRLGSFAIGLAVAGLAALVVVCASYGFQDMGLALADVRFRPGSVLTRLSEEWPRLRLPVPAGFLQGIDLLATPNQAGERTFYLAGELSPQPWRTYHLIAFALKTPLPFLLLAVSGFAFAAFARGRRPSERVVALGVAVVFAANAFLNPLNLGVRHVLPAEPLLCVLAGLLITAGTFGAARALGIAVVGLQAASALPVAPQYLTYFNVIAGGEARGHEWLVDSNLDWGQDLVRLREFLRERGAETVALAYFGTVHPATYGIRFTPLTPSTTGLAVISPTLLVGVPSTMWRSFDDWGRSGLDEYAWLRSRKPIARIGALFVYNLGVPQQPPLSPTSEPTLESKMKEGWFPPVWQPRRT